MEGRRRALNTLSATMVIGTIRKTCVRSMGCCRESCRSSDRVETNDVDTVSEVSGAVTEEEKISTQRCQVVGGGRDQRPFDGASGLCVARV